MIDEIHMDLGDGTVVLHRDTINALHSINTVFPGSRAIWWRRGRGDEWKRVVRASDTAKAKAIREGL